MALYYRRNVGIISGQFLSDELTGRNMFKEKTTLLWSVVWLASQKALKLECSSYLNRSNALNDHAHYLFLRISVIINNFISNNHNNLSLHKCIGLS